MENELVDLQLKESRHAIVGEYQMFGLLYEYPDGRRAWSVTAWTHTVHSRVRSYWVMGSEFLQVSIHSAYRMTSNTLIQTFGAADDIKTDEREAILEGILGWEKPRTS